MKMSIGKRLVLFVHWLLSVIVFLAAVLYCVLPDTMIKGVEFINTSLGVQGAKIVGGIFLAVYAVLAVLSVICILSKKQKDDDSCFITVISDDTGKTRIAVGAIEQMICIAVRGVAGIADLKTSIINETDSISISVNVAVMSGVHIPTVTSNIQRTISKYIELNCGVSVREVSVSVSALENPEDAGKRGRKKFGKGVMNAGSVPAAIEEMPEKAAFGETAPVYGAAEATAAQEEIIAEISAGDVEEA